MHNQLLCPIGPSELKAACTAFCFCSACPMEWVRYFSPFGGGFVRVLWGAKARQVGMGCTGVIPQEQRAEAPLCTSLRQRCLVAFRRGTAADWTWRSVDGKYVVGHVLAKAVGHNDKKKLFPP